MRRRRHLLLLKTLLAIAVPAAARADPPAFDLAGPNLKIAITRKGVTLPIGKVPSLVTGDRLAIAADFPSDQRAHYLLLAAFLSGATNPPPKKWISSAESWKRKKKDSALSLVAPDGARQIALFLVPDTGGADGSIADAVRGRPGEFVRATQELNQASLDRSRLDAFMAAIRAQENAHPEFLRTIAPTLARSLAIKLNEDCLARVVEMQAACLLENRDQLVLADIHSSSMSEALVGAPTDLALQLSYTREAGLGYYSPYIGVVRDIARVFGAFNNPQFGYLPTLSTRSGDHVALLLNAAPSFTKPKSVLVAALPAIGAASQPRLRASNNAIQCATSPDLVLPIEGAPLVFSTSYAHDMVLRITAADRADEVPVTALAARGGFVPRSQIAAGKFSGAASARLHGRWGFDPLDGPTFALQFPAGKGWQIDAPPAPDGKSATRLTGPAPTCVSAVALRRSDGTIQRLKWTIVDNAVEISVPAAAPPTLGDVLEITQYGRSANVSIQLTKVSRETSGNVNPAGTNDAATAVPEYS